MVTRVLVPVDESDMAERALRFALETHPEAEITVLHVVGEPSGMLGQATELALATDFEEAAEEQASKILDTAREVAAEYDTEIETIVEVGHPARAIVDHASDFDLVVIGSHGGSLADRLFIGNVAKHVFRRSPVPVTTVR